MVIRADGLSEFATLNLPADQRDFLSLHYFFIFGLA